MDDLIFAFDLVRGLGQELARGLFAQDVLPSIGAGQQISWIGLSEGELWGVSLCPSTTLYLVPLCLPVSHLMVSGSQGHSD